MLRKLRLRQKNGSLILLEFLIGMASTSFVTVYMLNTLTLNQVFFLIFSEKTKDWFEV